MTKIFETAKTIAIIGWTVAAVASVLTGNWQQAAISTMFAAATSQMKL